VKLLLGTNFNPLTCTVNPGLEAKVGPSKQTYDEPTVLAALNYAHVLPKRTLICMLGGTILHIAAASGNIAVVNQLIKMGPTELINKQSTYGSTAVGLAARHGHGQVVKALIGACCITSKADAMGRTLLHEALLSDNEEVYQVVAGKGALTEQLIQAEDMKGWSYCHFLAHAPCIAALPSSQSTLIKHKQAVAKQTASGEYPFHFAARAGHVSLAERFLERIEVARSCEKSDAAVSIDIMNVCTATGKTVLHCACESNSGALIAVLVQKGANLLAQDASGRTPFHYAARIASTKGSVGIHVQRLPHPEDESAIASLTRHTCALPLKQRAHIAEELARTLDVDGFTALQLAVKAGTSNAVVYLASLLHPKLTATKALVACASSAPNIAMTAYRAGHSELARLLLKHGAPVATSLSGANILHWACKNADHQFVNYALHCALWAEKGTHPPYSNVAAIVPKHFSSKAVNDVLAQRDAAGWQPLHCAVHSGSWLTVHCLLLCWGTRVIDAPEKSLGYRDDIKTGAPTDSTMCQKGLCTGNSGRLQLNAVLTRGSRMPMCEMKSPSTPTSGEHKGASAGEAWHVDSGAGSRGTSKVFRNLPGCTVLASPTGSVRKKSLPHTNTKPEAPVDENSHLPQHAELQEATESSQHCLSMHLKKETTCLRARQGIQTPLNALHLAGYLGSVKVTWLLLVTFYDSHASGSFGRNLLHYIALGPLQGAEPWLFSTAPRDSLRWLPPSAILASSSFKAEQQLAYKPYTQLGELALALQVPIVADELGAFGHHYAAGSGNAALLALFDKNMDEKVFTAVDKCGRNVLHYMLAGGADGMVEPLKAILQEYPDLADAQDSEGCLPLHYAAQVCLGPF
jgi:ankyrin repeat protein